MSRFFIDRPIFATVISILIVIVGLIAYFTLPVSQYPKVTPPTIVVRASFPGANPEVIADTVATPLEQEINGVEDMLYMSSQSTSNGMMQLTITFAIGTDIDKAQVLVENRIAVAEPRLPEEVRRIGITVRKSSPDMLLVVHLLSPDNTYDQLYISNYASIRVYDVLTRIGGVGNVTLFGAREYSMRVWLDPEKLYSMGMTVNDVVQSLREQNVEVAAGIIGQPPMPQGNAFQISVNTLGRLVEEKQFGDVIIRTGEDGRVTRLKDVARIELGARDYGVNSYLDSKSAQGLGIFQLPGSNALATAEAIEKTMARISKDFPKGLEYRIVYNPTKFVQQSINEVYHTLFIAFILVFIVVIIFLQDWKAALLPMIDAIVSLVGTFAVMSAFGFSLNNLTLFGLVIAIGIVVDDSIVVVENIKRWMSKGLEPREATLKAMAEITGPVLAITLVLSSVFIPTAFLPGISGQFYRQFALTIAVSTILSAINALTLAPARAVQLIKPYSEAEKQVPLPRVGIAVIVGFATYSLLTGPLASILGVNITGQAYDHSSPSHSTAAPWAIRIGLLAAGCAIGWFAGPYLNMALKKAFGVFNRSFDRVTNLYGRTISRILRFSIIAVIAYCGLIGLTYIGFTKVSTGFIPAQDQGYLIVDVALPDGASLERTDAVIARATNIILGTPGIAYAVGLAGFSGATFTNSSDAGVIFTPLAPFDERAKNGPALDQIIADLSKRLSVIQEARLLVISPPPVRGLGTSGGFKMMVEDRAGMGIKELEKAAYALIDAANQEPGLTGVYTTFSTKTPQIYVEVDRTKAKKLDVPLTNIFDALQVYLGSVYVNDINLFGRVYRVTAQAEGGFRQQAEDIAKLRTRSLNGNSIPLGSFVDIKHETGPDRVVRYNLFPAIEVSGATLPGFSSGQAIEAMVRLAGRILPVGMSYEWTELAYQEVTQGNTSLYIFPVCVLFVFLILSSLYESWSLPLTIVLIVPMCLLSAIFGIWLRGMDNNILSQIGFVVLVGLACKNAILIVEFAKDYQDTGKGCEEAVIEASRVRLRPILMTSFAFILGVIPLLIATGAGAEMRQALGTSVFSGMLGVTFFGLFLTPVFYIVIRKITESGKNRSVKV
ncbi:efflux RND transporter permease subunit [Candidatus Kuenenia stuttgartensis]|uniref:efflux RND transporter permease subunit n=1 Tax=Kuenenia stuttgartiensis TaxID=174633 RepID=UPI001B8AC09E|nr:efflux RND transporter permease subunit [Candidatus Kuenenia stuttgartiensis]